MPLQIYAHKAHLAEVSITSLGYGGPERFLKTL